MAESIYIETLASRSEKPREIVMLHGWAMHSGLLKELANDLTEEFRVHLVDMPGHGNSQQVRATLSLDNLANDIHAAVTKKVNGKAIWLGWSLGGLVATRIAELFPGSVDRLILLSSTPAFVKKNDWPHAVDKSVFQNFASELKKDLRTTLSRFLSLQVRGCDDSRQTLKQLRDIVFSKGMASENVLLDGLKILEQSDLRKPLNQLDTKVLLLGGRRDTLVPESALYEIANHRDNMRVELIDKAGHAPFLSHAQQCGKTIKEFAL